MAESSCCSYGRPRCSPSLEHRALHDDSSICKFSSRRSSALFLGDQEHTWYTYVYPGKHFQGGGWAGLLEWIQRGWMFQQWLSTSLHSEEAKNLGEAQSSKIDTSAVPFWSWRPGSFLESHWFSVHIGNLRKLGSDVSRKLKGYSGNDRWACSLYMVSSVGRWHSDGRPPFSLHLDGHSQRCVYWEILNSVMLTMNMDLLPHTQEKRHPVVQYGGHHSTLRRLSQYYGGCIK